KRRCARLRASRGAQGVFGRQKGYSVKGIMPQRISSRKVRRIRLRAARAVQAADARYMRVIEPPTDRAAELDQLAPLDDDLPREEAPVGVSAVQSPVAAEEGTPRHALALCPRPLLPYPRRERQDRVRPVAETAIESDDVIVVETTPEA